MEDAPSTEEFEAWKVDPVTSWYMKALSKIGEDIQDRLATGGALSSSASAEQIAISYARQVGITEGLVTALNYEPPGKEAQHD